jgi:hypothetical protein
MIARRRPFGAVVPRGRDGGPLRAVLESFVDERGEWERLECTHTIARRRDRGGYTTATRRRCLACRKGTERANS